VSGTERARQNGSGERQERDVHQQQGVEEQHHPVGAADVVEHDVMVGPHLPDEQEGDGVRQVGRPERGEAVEQVPGVLRRADLQDEQGDGDGEDRIAEEDDPRGIAFRAEPSAGSGWVVGRGGRCDRTEPADHQGDACSSAPDGQSLAAACRPVRPAPCATVPSG
jgi:hypothetical protein